jgi:hypothetical protein
VYFGEIYLMPIELVSLCTGREESKRRIQKKNPKEESKRRIQKKNSKEENNRRLFWPVVKPQFLFRCSVYFLPYSILTKEIRAKTSSPIRQFNEHHQEECKDKERIFTIR